MKIQLYLKNKNVLVTGSSRGIGKAIAKSFCEKGCNVILNASKSKNELFATHQAFKEKGFQCHPILADVSIYESCCELFEEIKSVYGDIDILINNAGISHIGLFSDMTQKQWKHLIEVNLYSVLNCTHLAIPSMISKHSGIIINISSMWGEKGASCEAVYSASKGAINSFTKSMAKELGPSQIRFNAISCGVIDTQMNACFNKEERERLIEEVSLMRYGKVEEVADLAVFLASEQSSFLTGQIITLDGCMF